eukprot:UN05647
MKMCKLFIKTHLFRNFVEYHNFHIHIIKLQRHHSSCPVLMKQDD